MIPMTMIGKVRRMFHRQNKSIREIARITSLLRNTIHKYLYADVPGRAEAPAQGEADAVPRDADAGTASGCTSAEGKAHRVDAFRDSVVGRTLLYATAARSNAHFTLCA
jgi:hypothetical protein